MEMVPSAGVDQMMSVMILLHIVNLSPEKMNMKWDSAAKVFYYIVNKLVYKKHVELFAIGSR